MKSAHVKHARPSSDTISTKRLGFCSHGDFAAVIFTVKNFCRRNSQVGRRVAPSTKFSLSPCLKTHSCKHRPTELYQKVQRISSWTGHPQFCDPWSGGKQSSTTPRVQASLDTPTAVIAAHARSPSSPTNCQHLHNLHVSWTGVVLNLLANAQPLQFRAFCINVSEKPSYV